MTPDAPRAALSDGDYILVDGAAWFTVDNFSIRIARLDHDLCVSIYPLGQECDDPLTFCEVPLT